MAASLNFKNIPEKSWLIAFGDCFWSKSKKQWQIECYFSLPSKEVRLINMPIEALPLLAINRTYVDGGILPVRGWEGKTVLPEQNEINWALKIMSDVPKVFTTHLKKEHLSQKVFRVVDNKSFVWIPAIELARFFLLKTGVNTRYAFYEGNSNAMASVVTENNKLIIRLDSRYPKGLLDNKAHQEYLAWFILNKAVQNSFSSIYEKCNAEEIKTSSSSKWTFNFNPFDLSGTCLEWRGLKTKEGCFVKEITSASNIKNMTQHEHEIICISHPKDVVRKNEDGFGGRLEVTRDTEGIIYEIDDQEEPSSWSQHRILTVPKGKLIYNKPLETLRLYNKTTVKAGRFKDEKNEFGVVIKVGITEGSYPGNVMQSDYDSIDESDYLEKFKDICAVTAYIQEVNPEWVLSSRQIDLPTASQIKSKKKGYKFYFIGSKRRQCYCTKIELPSSKTVFLLEIDLSDNRKLSTLILQLKNNNEEEKSIKDILRELVKNAGHWNRALINQVAKAKSYSNHPSENSLKKLNGPIDVWANRIIREINAQI